MVLLLLPVLLLSVLPDEPVGDLDRMQGTWIAKVGPKQDMIIKMVIKDDDATITVPSPPNLVLPSRTWKIRLDETTSPKQFVFYGNVGPNGEVFPESPGIYELDGDHLMICRGPVGERPKEFVDGPRSALAKYTRQVEEPQGDLAKMQGTWAANVEGGTIVVKIEGTTMTLVGVDGAERAEVRGTLSLDEAAQPKALDFQPTAGTGDPVNPSRPGIYQFQGDTLEICLGAGGRRPRPRDFQDDPANRAILLKLRKQPAP